MTHNDGSQAPLPDATRACLLAPGPREATLARDALSRRADRWTRIALADTTYRILTREMPDPYATRVPLNLGDCHLEWGTASARRILEEVVRRSPRPWAAEAALGLGQLLRLPDLARVTLYAIIVHAFGDRPDDERHALYNAFAAVLRAGSAEAGIAAVEASEPVLLSEEIDALLTRIATDDADTEAQCPVMQLAWLTRLTLRTCRVFGTAESRNWRPAIAALQELSEGTDEARLRDLLNRFPGLLSPVAAEFVADIVLQADPPGALDAARQLLEAPRTPGIDGVLDTAWNQGLLLPASLRVLLTEASATREPDDEASTRRAQQAWAKVMAHPALLGRPLPSFVLQKYATAQLMCSRTGFAPGSLTIAVDGLSEIVEAEPADAPGLSDGRRFLAEALLDRYEAEGDAVDLREARVLLDRPPVAAQTWEEAQLPFAHELLLCKMLMKWHARFDAPDDLERVVLIAGEVADQLAREPRDDMQERWAAALNQAMNTFADEIGPVGDDVAISVADGYLAMIHDDRINLANSYLAEALSRLFQRTGRLDYLDRVLDLERRTVRSRHGSASRHAVDRANLGAMLLQRFKITGDSADLDEAVTEMAQAMPLIPPQHAPRAQSMLSTALCTRAQISHDRSEMAEAIDWGARAVDGTAPGHAEYANRNNNLGTLYLSHWALTDDSAALDQAIRYLQVAVRYSARTDGGRTWRILNLAIALAHRYTEQHIDRDFLRAHRFFSRVASGAPDTYPEIALKGLSFWGAQLAHRRLWPYAASAYAHALRAEEQLFRTQAVRDYKEVWLAHGDGLASEAAYALHRTGDRAGAVLALERSRARLLSESLHMDQVRAALLRDGHKAPHTRYVAAVRRLRNLERTETA
ncbi:hypothetical protein [Streptomyces griseorubiginosus]|uniref:hypothetical protein n=1 Tax=Streptomyces griseorubiginosus TaxID=67304 RepID=UPI003668530C